MEQRGAKSGRLTEGPQRLRYATGFGDVTTGINHIKVFELLSKLVDVLKFLSDLDISKGRQSINKVWFNLRKTI